MTLFQQLLALQRNLASNPESFLRHLQTSGAPRGDLSLMAASLTGLTGLSGIAAGLGIPVPQFGFSPDRHSKLEHRFLQKRVVNDDDADVPDDKNPDDFSGDFFGVKRRKPNDEFPADVNGGESGSPMSLQKVQSKYHFIFESRCCAVVECMPSNRDVVGSNPACDWPFFCLLFSFPSSLTTNRSLTQV